MPLQSIFSKRRDLKNRVSYLAEIKEIKAYRDKHMSYSTSTLNNKSQGGDFILEGKVKRQKLIAPKGPERHGKCYQERLIPLMKFTTESER